MGLQRGGRRHGGHPLPGHIGRSWTALHDQIHHGCQPVRPVRTGPDARGHLCEGAARTVRKRVPGRLRRPGAGHAADVLLRLLSAGRAGPGHEGAAHDGLRPVCDRQPRIQLRHGHPLPAAGRPDRAPRRGRGRGMGLHGRLSGRGHQLRPSQGLGCLERLRSLPHLRLRRGEGGGDGHRQPQRVQVGRARKLGGHLLRGRD